MADQPKSRPPQRTNPVDWAEPEWNMAAAAARSNREREERDPKFKAKMEAARWAKKKDKK